MAGLFNRTNQLNAWLTELDLEQVENEAQLTLKALASTSSPVNFGVMPTIGGTPISEATAFLDLNDTPNSYSGLANGLIQINGAGTALVFVKNNYAGTVAPTVNNDDSEGYAAGSIWFDTTSVPSETYKCIDASTGSANWVKTSLTIDELGSMATQNANGVAITGGTIDGINITNLLDKSAAETISGLWNYTTVPTVNSNEVLSSTVISQVQTPPADDTPVTVASTVRYRHVYGVVELDTGIATLCRIVCEVETGIGTGVYDIVQDLRVPVGGSVTNLGYGFCVGGGRRYKFRIINNGDSVTIIQYSFIDVS